MSTRPGIERAVARRTFSYEKPRPIAGLVGVAIMVFMSPVDAHRFLADAMLGRLARWLRVLGYDTVYDARFADTPMVRLANEQQRVLLTRDRHLLRDLRPAHALEIRSDVPLEQLRGVVIALDLPPPAQLFTRCVLCNAPLSAPLPDGYAAALLPDGFAIPGPVRRCPGCGKLYWHGSHARRMRLALERALPGWCGD